MMLRLIVLMVSGGLAYAMLRGWPAVLPGLPRACIAVLLLVGGLSWWAIGRKTEDLPLAKGARKPGWLDFCSIGMGLLALECGFLWVLSAAPEPLEEMAIQLEERFRPEAAEKRAKAELQSTGGGNWLWEDERRRSLPMRTNLKPGAKPEVFIRMVKDEDVAGLLAEQIYVHAFALERFEGSVWSAAEQKEERVEAGADGWIRFDGEREGEILHEVFHGEDTGGRDVFTSLQGARGVRLPWLRVVGEGISLLPDSSRPSGYEYFASSVPVTLKDLEGADVVSKPGIPGDSDSRIRQIALRAAGQGTLRERLLNIENFLRENYTYSLVTTNPKNLEPLENFLFEEKRGHCEFFATAGALMARELGVEARVAYGWSGGQFFKANKMFVFRAREAHAWVEVNIEGFGWVLMEPTPPSALGGGGSPTVASEGEKFPEPEEVLAEEDEGDGLGSADVSLMAIGLAGAFAVGAALMVLVREKVRPEANGRSNVGGKEMGGYYAAWRREGRRRGVAEAGRTLKRQVEEMEERPPFAEELLGYHYGVKYEEKCADAELEKRLERKIRGWGGGKS